jgi:hypothetical protein
MHYYFSISMTAEQFLPYYQGKIQAMIVTCSQGKRVQFPAMHLRKYVKSSGVSGNFCLETKNNKFITLEKLS